VCERPACLSVDTQQHRRAERDAHDHQLQSLAKAARPARPAAADADGRGAREATSTPQPTNTSEPQTANTSPLAVVWLRPHEAALTELPVALSDALAQHLHALAAQDGATEAEPAALPPAAGPPARLDVQACSWCQGRCCRFGRGEHAFLEVGHLRLWQDRHPGTSLAEAAQAYIDHLPAQHVDNSCAFHGAQGCALPREMRSSICNQHVCLALDEIQQLRAAEPDRELILVMGNRDPDAAVLAARDGLLPLVTPTDDGTTNRDGRELSDGMGAETHAETHSGPHSHSHANTRADTDSDPA
jgi:hypothetical protein